MTSTIHTARGGRSQRRAPAAKAVGSKTRVKPPQPEKARKPRAGVIGDLAILVDSLQSVCGTHNTVWTSRVPVPVIAVFFNIGICSIEVTITGVGPPNSQKIPSRARKPQFVVHPAATQIDIDCLENVRNGDCTVVFLLIF